MIPAKGVPAKGIVSGKSRNSTKPAEAVEPKKPAKAKKAKE